MILTVTRNWTRNAQARAIDGCYFNPATRSWELETQGISLVGALALARLFPEHGHHVFERISGYVGDDIQPADFATPWAGDHPTEALLPGIPEHLVDVLFRYQAVDLGFLLARLKTTGGAYNGWDRGLGKTLGALILVHLLGGTGIVVCPRSSKRTVWEPEAKKWFPDLRTFNVEGTKDQRDKQLRWWSVNGGLLLIHYEALRLMDWTTIAPPPLLVVDEAHRLAKGGNKQQKNVPQFYRALQKVPAQHRLAMSGSIIINSTSDLWGALHWLFPNDYSAKWRDWIDRYLLTVHDGRGQVEVGVQPAKIDELRNELGGFMTVRSKQHEHGPPIRQLMEVDLGPSQRKVYDDLRDRFIAELPDGETIDAFTVAGKLAKLRQVATGLDLVTDEIVDGAKLDLATDLVTDNLPHKTVVFAWHRAAVDALADRLLRAGCNTVTVHGGHADRARAAAVDAFQTDPDVKCIVATISTLGESVTLHAAADVIFVEHSWTAADMAQAADRVNRIGQTRRVSVTEIVARDTVDSLLVLPTVRTKAALRALLFGST